MEKENEGWKYCIMAKETLGLQFLPSVCLSAFRENLVVTFLPGRSSNPVLSKLHVSGRPTPSEN